MASAPPWPILARTRSARGGSRSGLPPRTELLAALFPELAASPLAAPSLTLACGILRAPPRGRGSPLALSFTPATAPMRALQAPPLTSAAVLTARGWETPELLARAAAARRELVAARVGGDWWMHGAPVERVGRALVLLDEAGPADALANAMLRAALADYPPEDITLLMPNCGRRPDILAAAQGCQIVAAATDPWPLIEQAERIYCAGGETGFLALLAGREVRCFADSYYSGWGVTADAAGVTARPFRRGVDEIFAGACLVATRCLDPYRHRPAAFEDVVRILAEWRRIEEANRRIAVCVGMSFWKRRQVADFFRSTAGAPRFCRNARQALAATRARPGSAIAVWATRVPRGLPQVAVRERIPLLWVEDGFVRSVGLGSDFMPAASLVIDRGGMHYDPRITSDLERLLRETRFDPAMIERAGRLIADLVAHGITKYNLRAPGSPVANTVLAAAAGRRRILVPGQVEDDLSVRLGGAGVRGNADLLARVRAANPDAFIIYKPHPDVEAGHRAGMVPDRLARRFADAVVRDQSTASLLAEIDEVHTLTSLTGFEALLRRRRVVVYGRPFYAGWGLTADLALAGRGRRLSLEELVAGALIVYPRYLDPVTRLPCPPEVVLERLQDPRLWRPGLLVAARRLQGMVARRWQAQFRSRRAAPDDRS